MPIMTGFSGRTPQQPFDLLEIRVRQMSADIGTAFPWVKDIKTIQHPRIDLQASKVSLVADLGKGLVLILEGSCSDAAFRILDSTTAANADKVLSDLRLRVAHSTSLAASGIAPIPDLLDEELNPDEPTDLPGALSYARRVYDQHRSSPTLRRFPLGAYQATTGMRFTDSGGQDFLEVRQGTLWIERITGDQVTLFQGGNYGGVRSPVALADLWEAYRKDWFHPVSTKEAGEFTVTRPLTLHKADRDILWFPEGTILSLTLPGTIHGPMKDIPLDHNEVGQMVASGALRLVE